MLYFTNFIVMLCNGLSELSGEHAYCVRLPRSTRSHISRLDTTENAVWAFPALKRVADSQARRFSIVSKPQGLEAHLDLPLA